jgi:transcriptional regulator of acetoin/glycerol metabolism
MGAQRSISFGLEGAQVESAEFRKLQTLGGREPSGPLPALVADSWRRCLETYNLLPDVQRRAEILSVAELRDATDRLETLVRDAAPEIERLFRQLDGNDYLVSLASPEGVMLTFRCDQYWFDEMRKAGVAPGSIWAEEQQGTNGVGTCLKTGYTVSIVGDQHFNTAVKNLTCNVAPIFGAGGVVDGVLNVTSMASETPRIVALLRAVVENSARRIEMHYFHSRNAGCRLLNISSDGDFSDYAALAALAVNDAGQIVDASSAAPTILGRTQRDLVKVKLDQVLNLPSGFADREAFQIEPAVSSGKGLFAQMMPRPTHRSSPRTRPAVARRLPQLREVNSFADRRFSEQLAYAEKLIRGNLPVVINGEPGVGKSFFARVLAERGSDAEHMRLLLNAATPTHEVERLVADLPIDGPLVLILDQADETAVPVQRLLVSLLDNLPENTRLITVTTQAWQAVVSSGRIRRDLADRLHGSIVTLPTIRSAPNLQDIVLRLFELEAQSLGRDKVDLSSEVMSILKNYHWPGNLRELRHAARHSALLASDTITTGHLPKHIVAQLSGRDMAARSQSEATRIESALRHNGGNVVKTASYLGISRSTLYRKIRVHALRSSESPRAAN